jgi:hypothetical protein
MNLNLNAKTWQSAISSVGLVVGGALTWAGVVSDSSATEIVQQAVNAAPGVVSSIGAVISIGLAVHKAFQHTDAQVVQEASVVPGVAGPIRIDTSASTAAAPALVSVANDTSVATVQPAAPQQSSLYATNRQRT